MNLHKNENKQLKKKTPLHVLKTARGSVYSVEKIGEELALGGVNDL